MLWELLTAIGATMFVWAAVQTARQVHAGFGGYTAVISVGLILAIAYEYAAHKLARIVDDHLNGRSESRQNWYLRGLYLGSATFPVVAAFVGDYASSILLRVF